MIHLILACLTAGGGWAIFSPLRSETPLFNSPLAMPSPLATPYAVGLPGNWSYYQLWFKGEYDESAREFLRQLGSGNLPYEGNYTWLVWAGHEPRMQWELMAQLEEWALDSRPAIRQQTGQVIADLGSASPPLRRRAADLLVRMICREPDRDTRRALLYRMSWYFHDLNYQDVHTRGSACVTLAQLAPRLDTERQAQIAQAILAAFREGPIRYYSVPDKPATNRADCSLHAPAVSALGLLAASPSLNSETRRSVIMALAEILFEPLDDCGSRIAAGRALGDASHFISSTLAFTVTSNLIAVNPDPRSEAVYQAQVALARIEATQTLYYGQRLDKLLAKFSGATTEKDIHSYGAALFLTAACNAHQRPIIRAALSNIRDSLSSNAMAAGELVAMISLLDIASEAGQSPPRLDATRPFSRLFALCLDAMGGDNKMHKSFCPIKE